MENIEREKFWKVLCSLKGVNIEEDINQITSVIKYPKYICRYRPINTRNIEALQSNSLYFSSAIHYDDPFDTLIKVDWKEIECILNGNRSDLTEKVDKIEELLKSNGIDISIRKDVELFSKMDDKILLGNIVSKIRNDIRPKLQSNSYSICFSEDFNNENLWLKYADNHKGFCLVYDLEDNDKLLCGKEEKCKKCISNVSKSLYPVYYSNEKYDATEYAIKQGIFSALYEKTKDLNLGLKLEKVLPATWEYEKVSLIKHKCHEYDKEWRMILPMINTKDPIQCKWIPHSVIIGLRTKFEDEKLIVRSAIYAGIKNIYKTYIDINDDLNIYEYDKNIINSFINK